MIIGADKVIDIRRRGGGFRDVWLYVGEYAPDRAERRYPWWIHGAVPQLYLKAPSAYEDLRALVGLHVNVVARAYSEPLMAFFIRLQEYVRSACLQIESWGLGLDSVIWYDKMRGQTTLEAING